jgi:hypothetical protein
MFEFKDKEKKGKATIAKLWRTGNGHFEIDMVANKVLELNLVLGSKV